MTTLLDSLGRSSWQAGALALIVAVLLWSLGERMAPRWRYLLWSVVLVRLLLVVTPSAPWSVFNLAPWIPQSAAGESEHQVAVSSALPDSGEQQATVPTNGIGIKPAHTDEAVAEPHPPAVVAHAAAPAPATMPVSEKTPSKSWNIRSAFSSRLLPWLWLAGCCAFAVHLLGTALVLRRRLATCRPVTDHAIRALLETACSQFGLKRTPALFVTPEAVSPCIVGTWNPRIIVPESILTESPQSALRHVLAHELAHLVRGDLWTNWLLLAARVVHWFNPVAWWTIREMRAEREAACDELALVALGEADRSSYGTTIIDLTVNLVPSAIAPGMIGLFTSGRLLQRRLDRLVRAPAAKLLRAPLAVGLLLAIAVAGLFDAMPRAAAQQSPARVAAKKSAGKPEPESKTHTISALCMNDADHSPLAGVTVRLYRLEGLTAAPVEIAKTVTGADGRYTFTGLVPPRLEHHLDRLDYAELGFAFGRPIGASFFHYRGKERISELRMAHEKSTLSGRVIDAAGKPVAGATVLRHFVFDRAIPGLESATTDVDGRFTIDDVAKYMLPGGKAWATSFTVRHPDYPETRGTADSLPAEVVVTLPAGCVVTGSATDAVTKAPPAGAVIIARRADEHGETFAAVDAQGQFRFVLPEGRYDFLAEAHESVCVAQTDLECLAGQPITLPAFTFTAGGFISGQVVNTATGQPVTVTEGGEPIMLGYFGPSQPGGRVVSPRRLAAVDKTGRFTLRAAAGENFPYFVNTHGVRMAWDTRKQPPVVVKEGETIAYNMLITPEVPKEEKLQAAQKLVQGLPKQPAERTAAIIAEFRKLNTTVDETELWCMLMRELVGLGRDAVPLLCAELDQTTESAMLRRLGFALRAIGDPRAVPALVRALPRTLLPSSSDFGLLVGDKDLMEFMQTHDLDPGQGGAHFGLGRPVREIAGALHRLTGQNFDDAELFSISLSEDPRRQVLQRRHYARQAQRWQAWWAKTAASFTDEAAYQQVNLKVADEPLPPATRTLGKAARLKGEWQGAVISPAIERNQYAWNFYDLDSGYQPKWPAQIPRDESQFNEQVLTDWARENGIDLMCITHRDANGTETFVLRSFGMKVWEISSRDFRNLDKLIAAGQLPEGPAVGDLIMHVDPETKKPVPAANGAFLFMTAEGSLGLIEITDRVTRTADLTGLPAGQGSGGVGFHLGVRFNLKQIIP